MTIRTALVEHFDNEAEGDTIAEVLRSGLDAGGDTIGKILDHAAKGNAVVDDDDENDVV